MRGRHSFFGIGLRSGCGPSEDDHIGFRRGDLFVRQFFSGGYHDFAAGDLYDFGDPGRGTDAGIGPGFGIDAHAALEALRPLADGFEFAAHLRDQALCGSRSARDSTQQSNVTLDIGKAARIFCEEIQRLLEKLGDGFLFERNRADDKRGLQGEDFVDIVHLPAVTELRQAANFGDFGTPFGTPTNAFRAPMAQRMDVALGASETMRSAGCCALGRLVMRCCEDSRGGVSLGAAIVNEFTSGSSGNLVGCAQNSRPSWCSSRRPAQCGQRSRGTVRRQFIRVKRPKIRCELTMDLLPSSC